jgi:thioredoxin-related protein
VLLTKEYLILKFSKHKIYFCENKLKKFLTGKNLVKEELKISIKFEAFPIEKLWSKEILENGVRIDYN